MIVLLAGWLENYSELIRELKPSTSQRQPDDVELLLTLYRSEGRALLKRLSGPLAVLIWEPGRMRLTAMTDHLGERAVCFADRDELLALASEEAALFAHPGSSKEPDFGWLGRFVARLPLPPGQTAFRDIRELAPGEQGEWQGLDFVRRRIPPRLPNQLWRETDHSAYADSWRNALSAGIPSATRRGRRFGLMLSGGMDSTAVALFALPPLRVQGKKVAAYCWRFERFIEADESSEIATIADHLGIQVNWLQGDHLIPILEPGAWPVCRNVPQLNPFLRLNLAAYKAARNSGCDVMLNGHLGDYLYPYWYNDLTDALRLRNVHQVRQSVQKLFRGYGLLRCWQSPELRELAKTILRLPPRQIAPPFLAPEARREFERTDVWPPELLEAPHVSQWISLLGTTSALELKYERFFAERSGVERRHALRDRRILTCVLSLPSYLFFGAFDKQLTRDAIADVLPGSVVNRSSGGNLNALFCDGFFGIGKPVLESLLLDKGAFWPEIVKRDYLSAALKGTEQPNSQKQRLLLTIAGIELWRRALEDKVAVEKRN